jgi:ribulose 1,5-bisphosphate carboxylase large subunit-like protein
MVSEDNTILLIFLSIRWFGQAPGAYDAMGPTDLIYFADDRKRGHPDGPKSGVKSSKQG